MKSVGNKTKQSTKSCSFLSRTLSNFAKQQLSPNGTNSHKNMQTRTSNSTKCLGRSFGPKAIYNTIFFYWVDLKLGKFSFYDFLNASVGGEN